MNIFQYEGVIFDVDGVLFDTETIGVRVWREIGAEMNCPQPAQQYRDFVGRSRADILSKMYEKFGSHFPAEAFLAASSKRAMELMDQEGVPLKPGVREILAFLQEQHIPTALATSTYEERTRYRMERVGLTHYFQSMTTGDQVAHSKPDPEIYLLACQRLGTNPARTLAIEDSPNGIRAASAAGIPVVMIPDLIPPTPELERLLVGRFPSLLELLEDWKGCRPA
jgi:HAD superfamily hydrolase (TIGR01509 family)